MESRNASFFENIFPYKEKQGSKRTREERDNDKNSETETNVEISINDNSENEEKDEPRRSKRARKEKSFGKDFLMAFSVENVPKTLAEAIASPEAPFWNEAVRSEFDSIMQNYTYYITDLPPGCKALGNKWIMTRKPGGKYKSRLVVQGFRQKEVLDYFDTYYPVTRITSIRLMIAIAALRDLEIHQMDVKTAFLNGDLEEEIYMKQPEGFVIPGQED
ncbi:hypothetical protein YC2023_020275 [Brassica napus]